MAAILSRPQCDKWDTPHRVLAHKWPGIPVWLLSLHVSIFVCLLYLNWCLLGPFHNVLTHWGRVTHICVGKLTIIGSDNDLSPGRRQPIIWTNAGILLIRPLGTNISELLSGNHTFSVKMHSEMSSAKWRPFCLSLNVLSIEQLHWDHSGYVVSQWETTLHCNVVSHWLNPYQEWSLVTVGFTLYIDINYYKTILRFGCTGSLVFKTFRPE